MLHALNGSKVRLDRIFKPFWFFPLVFRRDYFVVRLRAVPALKRSLSHELKEIEERKEIDVSTPR